MTKLTSLEGKRKKAEPCPHCGTDPACPGWTCPRLKAVGTDAESPGYFHYEYVTPEVPREVHVNIYCTDGTQVLDAIEKLIGPDKEE